MFFVLAFLLNKLISKSNQNFYNSLKLEILFQISFSQVKFQLMQLS